MLYVLLYDKDGNVQPSISAKVQLDEPITYQNLRSGGCGTASFTMESDYENDTNIAIGYYVEIYDDTTAPDTLVYSGRIIQPTREISGDTFEKKIVHCFGFAQELDEILVTITARGCTVKEAITLLFTQFPPSQVTFNAGNVAAMTNTLTGDGYTAENVSLAQAVTDLCNLQTDGSNQPYIWYVGPDKAFHTAALAAAVTKEFALDTFTAVDGGAANHSVTETRTNIRNKILATGGNKANGQPVKCIVQDLTSISTYGARYTAVNITNAADNGSGLIRVTAAGHGLDTTDAVEIAGVVGTVEANGTWTVIKIDSANFDLVGSTFANAYISDGTSAKMASIQGSLTNTRIKDQTLLETWATGQLQKLAYPVLTGNVEVTPPGYPSLTGQDYVRISGFTGGATWHDYYPVSVETRQDGLSNVTTTIQLSNFKPDLYDVFRQSVLRAEALAGDSAPQFKVALQHDGVFLGGGNAEYVLGEMPAFHENDAGAITTGGFLTDQTINFSGSFTIEFDLHVRAVASAVYADYVIRNDHFRLELSETIGGDVYPNFYVYDPAGYEGVSCTTALGMGDKKKVRVSFNDATKYMYIALDGVLEDDNTGNPATSAAGAYKLRFGGPDANKLLDWLGNVKIEMAYRGPSEPMCPSQVWQFLEGGGTTTKTVNGDYTATLDGGVAADIVWRGALKTTCNTAQIKLNTGDIIDVTGSDLTLVDNRVNYVFAGSDGAWHSDTTNTYLDTDASAILCYMVPVINGTIRGWTDVRPVGGTDANSIYFGSEGNENEVNLGIVPGLTTATTSAYQAKVTDGTITADATGGAYQVTLPNETNNKGKRITVKKIDATANGVTVAGMTGTIDGAASKVLTTQYAWITVECDGTNWNVVGANSIVGGGHTQNTDTGTTNNTFTIDSDSAIGKIIIDVATGAADKSLTITNTALTDDRIATFKDEDGTVAYLTDTHTQNTDTGTDSQTFQLQTGSAGAKLKNNAGVVEARNAADGAYANLKAAQISTTAKIGVGTDSPTEELSFANDAAKEIWIENSATDVVGRALDIVAGSTVAGTSASNVAGGDLTLSAGAGTGSGASDIIFKTGLGTSANAATGGTITYSGLYTIHTFTGNGNFIVLSGSIDCDILLIGGGGGGGSRNSGGGGAGGYVYSTAVSVTGTNAIVIGTGGTGSADGSEGQQDAATDGVDTTGFTLTAHGGGAGKSNSNGNAGGSGGGGGGVNVGGAGTALQGNDGGDGASDSSTYWLGGGGGGATAAGADASAPATPGTGGAGTSNSISGAAVTYSTGGDGSSWSVSAAGANGVNPGDGGGAGGGATFGGGDGADGIVIVRYLTSASAKTLQTLTQQMKIDNAGTAFTKNIQPLTDDTYYLGKNDDDSPLAFKGLILKDTTNGKYYRIEIINGVVTPTDLTD